MNWLANLRMALDEAHEDHSEDGYCDCYERLCDALDGKGFRFPEGRYFSVAEPPMYGCETPAHAAWREMTGSLEAGMYAKRLGLELTGLSAALDDPKQWFIPVVITP